MKFIIIYFYIFFLCFLNLKVINAERTSLKGGEFRGSILRTRKEMLESVVKGMEKQT